MGNFFSNSNQAEPAQNPKESSSSRKVTFSEPLERQDIPTVVTQTESLTSLKLKSLETLREECNDLRKFMESSKNSISPHELSILKTTLEHNEQKLVNMLKTLNKELESKLKKQNLKSKNKTQSQPKQNASELTLNLSASETKFLGQSASSLNGIISIKFRLQSLEPSPLPESNKWIFEERSEGIHEWVQVFYEYNISSQFENLNVLGPFHTLLPSNYDEDDPPSLLETETMKKLRYFYKYLDYILNNSTGIVGWNGFIIQLKNHTNPKHYRLQIIDLDINPSRIVFNVKGYQKIRVLRSPKELKLEGYDSMLMKKEFIIYKDISITTSKDVNAELRGSMLKDLQVSTPGNGTLILHFPQR